MQAPEAALKRSLGKFAAAVGITTEAEEPMDQVTVKTAEKPNNNGSQVQTQVDGGDYSSTDEQVSKQSKETKQSGSPGLEPRGSQVHTQLSDYKNYTLAQKVVMNLAKKDPVGFARLVIAAEDEMGAELGGPPAEVEEQGEASEPVEPPTPEPAGVDVTQVKLQETVTEKQQEVQQEKAVVDELQKVLDEISGGVTAKRRKKAESTSDVIDVPAELESRDHEDPDQEAEKVARILIKDRSKLNMARKILRDSSKLLIAKGRSKVAAERIVYSTKLGKVVTMATETILAASNSDLLSQGADKVPHASVDVGSYEGADKDLALFEESRKASESSISGKGTAGGSQQAYANSSDDDYPLTAAKYKELSKKVATLRNVITKAQKEASTALKGKNASAFLKTSKGKALVKAKQELLKGELGLMQHQAHKSIDFLRKSGKSLDAAVAITANSENGKKLIRTRLAVLKNKLESKKVEAKLAIAKMVKSGKTFDEAVATYYRGPGRKLASLNSQVKSLNQTTKPRSNLTAMKTKLEAGKKQAKIAIAKMVKSGKTFDQAVEIYYKAEGHKLAALNSRIKKLAESDSPDEQTANNSEDTTRYTGDDRGDVSDDLISDGTDTSLESIETSDVVDDARGFLSSEHNSDVQGSTTAKNVFSKKESAKVLAILKEVDAAHGGLKSSFAKVSQEVKTAEAQNQMKGVFIEALKELKAVGDSIENLIKHAGGNRSQIREKMARLLIQGNASVKQAKRIALMANVTKTEAARHKDRFDRVSPAFKLASHLVGAKQISVADMPVKVAEFIRMSPSEFNAVSKTISSMKAITAGRRSATALSLPHVGGDSVITAGHRDELDGCFDDEN